ncbi:MAG: signal peptidase II [Candidatus Susulua stagnicola]|nr:signal peptidase II [Candidatus Susulua stagnicola]
MAKTWITATIVFFSDFLVKSYFHSQLSFQSIPIIKNIFHITLVYNRGAAFGILQKNSTFLIYISIAFIFLFLIFIKKENSKRTLFLIASGLIIGGALSNLWDRLFLGYVIDYIDFRVWPVFNISDSCITTGVFFLLWDSCYLQKKVKSQK